MATGRQKLGNRELRREAVTRDLIADPKQSNRRVATATTSDPKTVATIRRELESAGRIPPRTPPVVPQAHGGALLKTQPGNTTAATHGVDSEVKLAPLRAQGEELARTRWPWLDPVRAALFADLSARTELARQWIEVQGTVVRNKSGDVFAVVDRLERWSARLEDLVTKFDREAVERGRVSPREALALHLQERYGSES